MDLVGQKLGRLTVLEKDKNKGDSNHPYWICQCDCGTIKSIRQDVLKSGSTSSCGCYAREEASKRIVKQGIAGHNFEDLTGQRFGQLTVLGIYDKKYVDCKNSKGYYIRYKCKCDCGTITIVEGGNLRQGHTVSCGCIRDSQIVTDIIKILDDLNIKYLKDCTFNDCRSDTGTHLKMDLYLPEYNIVIEIDGEQHYYTTPQGYYTQERIDRIKELDKMKNNYCKKKKITMIRIPYTEWEHVNKNYIYNLINNYKVA